MKAHKWSLIKGRTTDLSKRKVLIKSRELSSTKSSAIATPEGGESGAARQKSPQDRIKLLFEAWFNNRMTVLLMYIQSVRFREGRALMKTSFFLEEIENHFISSHAPLCLRQAFRYLKRYLSIYPRVTRRQSQKAMRQVAEVYRAMGYPFHMRHQNRTAG